VDDRYEQKRRLLAEYDSSTGAFSACVSNLNRQIGTSSREAFEQLPRSVDEARVQIRTSVSRSKPMSLNTAAELWVR
jgi:hypothetical protein